MRHYVCGFLFTPDRKRVALIKKQRPKWQAGLYNGIGGKVEDSDTTPLAAMQREFMEETGVWLDTNDWTYFGRIINSDSATKSGPWTVHFFKSFAPGVATLQSPTDEQVRWWHVNTLASELNDYFVPNLNWLIPMALEDLTAEVHQHNWPHEQ